MLDSGFGRVTISSQGAFMKIGPFNTNDLNGIKQLLENKRISYEIEVDQEAEREILTRFTTRLSLLRARPPAL